MPHPQTERRRSVRISPKGAVVLLAGERIERGRLANLSSGGLLAITDERPPEALRGAEVEIELRLDAPSSEWLRLTGRVVRLDARGVAIALDAAPEPFARLVARSASASNAHRRARSVVLVDANAARRGPIAAGFRAAGCAVLEVAMPLEAVVRLGESQFEPELIAIADSLPSTIADDLRRFVAREHPRATLVTIGDAADAPPGHPRWLSAADPRGDLVARIRALLGD